MADFREDGFAQFGFNESVFPKTDELLVSVCEMISDPTYFNLLDAEGILSKANSEVKQEIEINILKLATNIERENI